MPAKGDVEHAKALVEQLGATCAEALIDWGEAVNDYESTPEGHAMKPIKLKHAQFCGGQAMELGKKLAAKLRPNR